MSEHGSTGQPQHRASIGLATEAALALATANLQKSGYRLGYGQAGRSTVTQPREVRGTQAGVARGRSKEGRSAHGRLARAQHLHLLGRLRAESRGVQLGTGYRSR